MFIAHLPAGYLVTRATIRRFVKNEAIAPQLMAAGLTGSVFPDIDLIRYFMDNGMRHHHTYWTHLPAVWLVIIGSALVLSRITRNRTATILWMIFGLNLFIHLVLDSIVGDIWWLWPWLDHPFAMATVPATHQPWYLNFLLHWSFSLEVALCLAAGVTLWRSRKSAGMPLEETA